MLLFADCLQIIHRLQCISWQPVSRYQSQVSLLFQLTERFFAVDKMEQQPQNSQNQQSQPHQEVEYDNMEQEVEVEVSDAEEDLGNPETLRENYRKAEVKLMLNTLDVYVTNPLYAKHIRAKHLRSAVRKWEKHQDDTASPVVLPNRKVITTDESQESPLIQAPLPTQVPRQTQVPPQVPPVGPMVQF